MASWHHGIVADDVEWAIPWTVHRGTVGSGRNWQSSDTLLIPVRIAVASVVTANEKLHLVNVDGDDIDLISLS